MNQSRNADLEQAIASDPDDLGAYQVYADWLLEQGDPRGELIAVSLALHANPDDAALQRRELVLQAEQAAEFLAGLGEAQIDLSWRFGFLDTLWIHPDPMLEVSAQALADPVAVPLRSLEVTGWSGRDGTEALAGAAALRHLRLATGTRISSEAVAEMCAGLPRLTAIDLRGYSLEPWAGLPAVDALGVNVRVLRAGALATLLGGPSRDVSIAAEALHGNWEAVVHQGIEQFLYRSDDATRRSLGLFHPELARAALSSKQLSRLKRLALSWEQLDDDHRERLARRRNDLATVELFDRLDVWQSSGGAEHRRRAVTARAWVLHRCLARRDEAAALLRREALDVAALEREWELALASSHHPGLPAPVAPRPALVEPDAQALRQTARRLLRERRFDEAYLFCEQALDRAPDDAELRLRRLEAMFMNGDDVSPHLVPALDMVDLLLGGDSGAREDRFEWWNLKGWLCSGLARWDEAEVCFRAALALDPSDEPTQARVRLAAEIASTEAMFASE